MLRALRMSAALWLWVNTAASQPSGAVHRHVTGLSVRLPLNWSARDNTEAVVLLPPGADTKAEVYMAVTQTGYSSAEEGQFLEAISAGFLRRGTQPVAEREPFEAG